MVSKLRGRCRYGPFPPDHSPQWLLPPTQPTGPRSEQPTEHFIDRHPMLLPPTGQPRRGRPERPASAAPTSYSERDGPRRHLLFIEPPTPDLIQGNQHCEQNDSSRTF